MMKKHTAFLVLIISTANAFSQALPGTLDVIGQPNIIESVIEIPTEAGDDQSALGFESEFNAQEITFILDPTDAGLSSTTSEQNCSANVYLYKVFIHTDVVPDGLLIEARTINGGGTPLPATSPYDLFNTPFGPRTTTPENGGSYIPVPDDGTQAIKVFEFVGCRENIPVQFRVTAESKVSRDSVNNVNVYYTITATIN